MEQHSEVIWLGDSIINRIQEAPIWRTFEKRFRCVNLGTDGLTVEDLLRWLVHPRLSAPLVGFDAKAVVLLIGTNNVGVAHTPQYIASKIEEIVENTRRLQPSATLFVVELLPKSPSPSPYRDKNAAVNRFLQERFQASVNTKVINLDPGFVDSEGRISQDDLYDGLHLTDDAYERTFFRLYDELLRLPVPERDQ